MTRRTLTPEEVQLWQKVTRRVSSGETQGVIPRQGVRISNQNISAIKNDTRGRKTHVSLPIQAGQKRAIVLRQAAIHDGDPNQMRRVAKGRIPIEATLDLHGLYQEEAYTRLCNFLQGAHQKKKKCVLIITGKGAPGTKDMIPQRVTRGILRHRFISWVEEEPLRHIVISIRQAHLRHGGAGAFYVFLRKSEKYTV